MKLAGSQRHDLFVAHAGADRAAAESLFDLLEPDVRAWLDTRCLLPGDEWPVEIPRAQRSALATVILVSNHAEHAYYLCDEIHTAIALHRSFPDEHRAVAVFIDGRPADPMQVPYGLRGLHSLDAIAEGGLAGVAARLKVLVATLRGREAVASRPRSAVPVVIPMPASLLAASSPPTVPTPVDRAALYERLCKLTLGGQLDALILRAGLPREHIRPEMAPLSQRALDIVQLVDQGGSEMAARVQDALARAAPAGQPNAVQPLEGPSGQENARRPLPSYPDEITRALSTQIEQARARKRALEQMGVDTAEIDREILQLRRQLREGGQLRPGDALGDGRYLLIQRLGRGGFAVVWEAYDEERQERVAVKVLHSELAGDVTRRERFFRGARIMAELHDAAVVRVLEPHAEEGGYHYFVMDLLTGGDLRHAVLGGRLAGEAILPAILPVVGALAIAHAKGLFHRDIKPANILLDAAGALRLTDFDLVGGGDTTGGTKTGAMGTFLYAPPELMHRPQDANARADVYGLGMTIAFGVHGAELPMNVLRDGQRFIDGLCCSEPVKAVLRQAIDWNPEVRFADASKFCEALREASARVPGRVGIADSMVPRADPRDAAVAPPRRVLLRGPAEEEITEHPPAGAAWREAVTGMTFLWVPPGVFVMGSSKQHDPEAFIEEMPAREVELPRGVWMAEHPVTHAQYGMFLPYAKHDKRAEPAYWPNQRFNAAEQPVIGVSFDNALNFCAWLTDRVGLKHGYCFDLPTEAEWEHAARGSDGRKYPWGNANPTPERAYFGQPWKTGAPAPTGGHPAGKSPFGCQDMAGNVWEWCLDAWQEGYGHMTTKRKSINPCHYGDRRARRVVRGGSWQNVARSLRCAYRDGYDPGLRGEYLGFRVVCRGFRQPWLVGP